MSEKFLNVRIERIVPDGYGIGFADNLTVFVPLVAPGDLVKIKIERQKGKVAFANLIEVLEFSEKRVKPPCPYFGGCGGCDFQQLNYPAQLDAKVSIIRDCLRRIGKIEFPGEIKITPSPAEWNYRTRAQWKRENGKIGYYERNSHRVRDVAECPILVEPLQKVLQELRGKQIRDFLEAQAVAADEEISLRFEKTSDAPEFDENFYAANKTAAEKSRDAVSSEKTKSTEISLTVSNFRYFFSADTFFQVNHRALPAFIKASIGGFSGNNALDLYCGVGLFTLPLAEQFKTVTGIEGNRASIEFARKNADSGNLKNARFEVSAVGEWLKKNEMNLRGAVDFVLLDPPRGGAEKEAVEALISLNPEQIAYVSCNPATLARDLRVLLNGGYKIEKIEAFDFFPQTHHVETIAHLSFSQTS